MDNNVKANEKFEIVHKMSRRIASIDKYCVISVSNKAFEEYFGRIVDTLLEVVAPQDGTVATVECAAGDSVESGKVLVSMN